VLIAGRFGGYSSVVHGSIQVKPNFVQIQNRIFKPWIESKLITPLLCPTCLFLQKLILVAFAYEEPNTFH